MASKEEDELLGISAGDLGRDIFGGVHTAGKLLASAFGAGGAANALESLESGAGLLPDWAKSHQAPKAAPLTVTAPDAIVVQKKGAPHAQALQAPTQVVVTGGSHIDGNGYQPGDKNKFSFGIDAPQKVEVLMHGQRSAIPDVEKILFLGGVVGQEKVHGDEVLGFDWRAIFYDPAGELYRMMNPGGGGRAYMPGYGTQNPYFARLRAQQATPFNQTMQSRLQQSQQLQQALRQQQAAYLAQMQAQLLPKVNVTPSDTSITSPDMTTQPSGSLAIPDPNNPGYLTDGSPDPTYQTVQGDVMTLDLKNLSDQVLGDLNPQSRVSVEDDYLHGCDVLGAAPVGKMTALKFGDISNLKTVLPRQGLANLRSAGFVPLKSGVLRGRSQMLSIKLNKNAKHTPAATLNNAKIIAKRAQQVGKKLLAASKKVGKTHVVGAGRLGTHAPDLGTHRPDYGDSVIGAVVRRVLPGRKPKLGPAQMKQLAQKLINSGKALDKVASNYSKKWENLKRAQKSSVSHAQAVTHIHGLGPVVGEEEIVGLIGQGYEVLGVDPNDPSTWATDPTTGYPIDPTTGVPIDPGTGLPVDGSAGATSSDGGYTSTGYDVPGPPDYGANALFGTNGPPTLADVQSIMVQQGDYAPDPHPDGNDLTEYTADSLPLGYVVYNGSIPPPHMGLGNYTVFFGQIPGSSPPKGGPGSGYSYHADGHWWLELMGKKPEGHGYHGNHNYDKVANPSAGMVYESDKNGWGPLIGAPDKGWTRGLRFSPTSPPELGGGPMWFWYFDTAPDWAKQPIVQARLNDLLTQYQAAVVAGQTDFTNAQIQAQLDAQTQDQLNQQQAVADAQYNQQMQQQQLQEAAFEQQMMQQQMQLQVQAQQADLQMQQAQAAFYAQHPEMFAQTVDYGGGGGYVDYGASPGDLGNPFSPDSADGIDWGDSGSGSSGSDISDGIDWGS